MKEILKIKVNDFDRQEVIDLLGKLGKSFPWDVKTRWGEISVIYTYQKQNLEWDQDHGDAYFQRHGNKEITIKELRELAKPREYLDETFKLVVTNQPKDGWRLVPDGADYYVNFPGESKSLFYRINQKERYLEIFDHWQKKGAWSDTRIKNIDTFNLIPASKLLWQRNPKVATMNTEKKGRFLHQEWYEAFGRGEDVQHTPCERDCDWTSTSIASPISIFSAREMKFRLKPQTITIGSRTINKPISVKPESVYFIASITHPNKFVQHVWTGHVNDNMNFNRKICHLSESDAIAHSDAILELMK